MKIFKDSSMRMLKLSHEAYILKVLNRFNVEDAKPRNSPLPSDITLTGDRIHL